MANFFLKISLVPLFLRKKVFEDPTFWFLLASNLVTIFYAVRDEWNILTVLWIYWVQSVIIGVFQFARNLEIAGYMQTDPSVAKASGKKKFSYFYTAIFFAVHFSLFQYGYYQFLTSNMFSLNQKISLLPSDIETIYNISILFFINHLFSHFYNRKKDLESKRMNYPIARIFPMHFTIIFGTLLMHVLHLPPSMSVLPFFLVLKTYFDCTMHISEHRK